MATRMKMYDTFFAEAKKQGKSDADAHIYAAEKANEGAVRAIDEIIRKPMSKSESEAKAFGVRAKMEAKLKIAEEGKTRREKLGKMSIEELKELKVKRGK